MKHQKGFTLIEILVVLAIMAGMIAVVAPNILDRAGEAKVKTARTEMANIAMALNLYKLDNFRYPSTSQGIEALTSKPSGSPEPKNYKSGGYMKKMPIDPWGTPYLYFSKKSNYEIVSLGADGEEGGEEDAADISSED